MTEEVNVPAVDVSICVATFRRPELLARLLEALEAERRSSVRGFTSEVVVVDNDPEGSAYDVVMQAPDVRYLQERRPGIAAARNAAVRNSHGRLVVFIDDDEVPCRGWLRTLVEFHEQSPHAVTGAPVVTVYPHRAPRWIVESGLLDRSRHPSGSPVRWPATNNVVIDRRVLPPEPFDDRFGLTGGEDTHLFMRLAVAGHDAVWCDEAEVYEEVPRDRLRLRWMLGRSFRAGNTLGRCEREVFGGKAGLRRAARAGATILRAPTRLLRSGPPLRSRLLLVAADAARGMGALAGLVGHRVEEYRR